MRIIDLAWEDVYTFIDTALLDRALSWTQTQGVWCIILRLEENPVRKENVSIIQINNSE